MYSHRNTDVFKFIESKGGDKAVVYFSGGNDEGGVDFIYILKDWKKVVELDETLEQEFYNILSKPVRQEYANFAGEYYVAGTVVWNCKTGTVSMSDSCEEIA